MIQIAYVKGEKHTSLQGFFKFLGISPAQKEGGWPQNIFRVDELWSQRKGKNVRIALLDTGVVHHEAIKEAIKGEKNFTNEPQPEDLNGHGTHCAGIMVGKRSIKGAGFPGIAPEADLYVGKILNQEGKGSIEWLAAGMDWAVREVDAHIIALSISTPRGTNLMYQCIYKALAKGKLIIAAAGNEGSLAQNGIGYPGKYGGVITVAAHDEFGRPSGFSSTGGEIDFMAPGTGIWSCHEKKGYQELSGTSMAVPFVAGLSALILSDHLAKPVNSSPIQNNDDLKAHLMRMAAHPGYHDQSTGYGPLLPFHFAGGMLSNSQFPDMQTSQIHSKPGESLREADDREDIYRLKDRRVWESLCGGSMRRSWENTFPAILQERVLKQRYPCCFLFEKTLLDKDRRKLKQNISLKEQLAELGDLQYPFTRFGNQPSIPGFSGILIGPRLVLTCQHGLFHERGERKGQAKELAVVFGYANEEQENNGLRFREDQVYFVEEILWDGKKELADSRADLALVRLDREVLNYQPLTIDQIMTPQQMEANTKHHQVYMFGHPLGLPLKFASDAQLIMKLSKYQYITDLDAFGGNSGSPVFHAESQQLIGIFVAGPKDEFVIEMGADTAGEVFVPIHLAYPHIQFYLNHSS